MLGTSETQVCAAKKSPDDPLTSAEIGRQYCDKLFAIEDSLKGLTSEERKVKRLELEKPVPQPLGIFFT